MKMKIENLDQVLAIAKMKQKGWKRDYDKEPWIEDKEEWFARQLLRGQVGAPINWNEVTTKWTMERELKRKEEASYRKSEFKRWRKRK